ncbi:MAG TPA: 1-deoxy-D-xylulose-5-phosphate reductoisomerase [Spirochaetaceae bacterium]|nr:1-deoxy-D-xylulose-5-phosphate reductoisomerase [Spirochaetaceae bacterium]
MSKRVIVLGATGSIGRQTLDVIRESTASDERLELVGFSVHSNRDTLKLLNHEFPHGRAAWTGAPSSAPKEASWAGPEALAQLLSETEADIAVNGIAGAAGLSASILVLQRGMHLALANKESVVMGYRLLKKLADEHHCAIIPVDSEHAGLFQLIQRIGKPIISELTITASGGPFRMLPIDQLSSVTADDACKHPVWKMGRKISIDAATMANKGLELIEAARLFDMPQTSIRVLIHPQSYVHAMVRTLDGALYAQISKPDMRLPIHMALSWPNTTASSIGFTDLVGQTLEFYEPEKERYPLLWIARQALDEGEAACIVYNAANEVAVQYFEQGNIRFTQIATVVTSTLEKNWNLPIDSFEDILHIDSLARTIAANNAERIT